MARSHITPFLAATSVVALLAGCTNEAGGALQNEYALGTANAFNTGVQSGEISLIQNLNKRFSTEVEDTINFAFNSARLDGKAQAVLARQATWIRQFPELKFRVYGHTDLVGSNAYNKRLGLRRANAAVNYLVGQGISRSRLEAVVSFGETQPLVVTEQPEMRNRRTVTEVSGFAGRRPTVLDGKYAQIIYREYVDSATRQTDTERGGIQAIESGQ